ncbi:MAG: FHA domain-containing protein [Ktedonobacteraceae bacterium]|nr:FHA domain-containing protein [Ktedonobacteraceae bacterium]
MMDKDKCPYCGAETRPGDNFCLSCGHRLSAAPANVPQQAQSASDATVAAPDDWGVALNAAPASSGGWPDEAGSTIADPGADLPYSSAPTAQPHNDAAEQPARFTLRSENGEALQEYLLDKPETTIGRAPNSDILLSKDKLTSRRHATVHHENGRYTVRDERSANGTFVNGQQIEELVPVELNDGDHLGIGEHELIFQVAGSVADNVENMPTIAVPYEPQTYRTQDDDQRTIASNDDYGTSSMEVDQTPANQPEVAAPVPEVVPEPVAVAAATNGSAPSVLSTPLPAAAPVSYANSAPAASTPSFTPEPAPSFSYSSAPADPSYVAESTPVTTAPSTNDSDVSFNRLSKLSQPTLPDMTDLTAALSTLDGQVMSLQQQLHSTQEALQAHDAEVAQAANQLRTGVRKVSERMDNTIADVARTREALAWAELLQLMEDVMNNPRDIEYVTKLARKARELNKVFQLHQSVLNTMAECNSLLRNMISEDER